MSVIKDLVERYEVTTDRPSQFGGSSPTYTEFKGTSVNERLGEAEDPAEEPTMQDISDGRQVQASVETEFTQTIFEDDESSAIFDLFNTAAKENDTVWLRRTNAQDGTSPEIIGGKLGLTVGVGKVRQGDEGHRAFEVTYTGKGVEAGTVIQEEGGGS